MDPVDADIARALTLPAEAFVDDGHLRRELATIFRSSWLFVPQRSLAETRDDPRDLAALVSRRGSRAPFSLLDRPLFLQRDWEGALRAFPNVCTHAWHTLVQGPGRDRTVTCPQHGRQFDATGRFVSQPGFEKADAFPRPEDHLQPFPVGEWDRFLFTVLGEPAVLFQDAFAPVLASVAHLPVAAFERRPMAGEVREVDGNWKNHAWNYLDRFHIPFVHRKPGGLADALHLDSYRTEIHGEAVLQWAYAKDPTHGFDPAMLPDRFRDPGTLGGRAGDGERRVYALWWFVFPNLALNLYPWGLSVNVFQPVPGKPQKTLFLWYHFVLDAAKYERRETVWMNTDVDLEDQDAMAQVARGVASGHAPRGRFAPGEEEGPHWFHRKVWERAYAGRP